MQTSEARIRADQVGSEPLTAEVARRFAAFRQELQPSGEVGLALVRRAAVLSVRMEKCAEREMAASSERVTRALVEFEAPEGVTATEAARLRTEAGRIAAFDTSKESILARRHESAAERGFYRALKELRVFEKSTRTTGQTADPIPTDDALASFWQTSSEDARGNSRSSEMVATSSRKPRESVGFNPLDLAGSRVDVPITIGRTR